MKHAMRPKRGGRKSAAWATALAAAMLSLGVGAQTTAPPPNWAATQYFQYNIEQVKVSTGSTAGAWKVRAMFSVTNPVGGFAWDILGGGPFKSPASLTLDIGWDPSTDFTNPGSQGLTVTSVNTPSPPIGAGGIAPAAPVQVRNLTTSAKRCTAADCPGVVELSNRFWVEKEVTPGLFVRPVTRGRVGHEGKPVCDASVPGCTTDLPAPVIPAKSAVADFVFAALDRAMIADARRAVVDIAKCRQCHDGGFHGDTTVPRLSLHGNNRTENLGLCVVCHNPNQTDVAFRYASTTDPRVGTDEVPIDFKTMVHSIHAGGFREKPFVVIGRDSSINDFSGVRFPSQLRNCLNCHVEVNGRGTFELPVQTPLGTTVKTMSNYSVPAGSTLRTISVDPRDDLRITPTAAVCSSCHDKSEVRRHMESTGGASFSTTQDKIGTTYRERCANCHGQGKDKDVRRVHEVGGSGSDD